MAVKCRGPVNGTRGSGEHVYEREARYYFGRVIFANEKENNPTLRGASVRRKRRVSYDTNTRLIERRSTVTPLWSFSIP